MTPNTFKSITLAKPEGELRFSTGYTWTIKLRTEDEFRSMTEALGIDTDRGLAHAGVVCDPNEAFHVGAVAGLFPTSSPVSTQSWALCAISRRAWRHDSTGSSPTSGTSGTTLPALC